MDETQAEDSGQPVQQEGPGQSEGACEQEAGVWAGVRPTAGSRLGTRSQFTQSRVSRGSMCRTTNDCQIRKYLKAGVGLVVPEAGKEPGLRSTHADKGILSLWKSPLTHV